MNDNHFDDLFSRRLNEIPYEKAPPSQWQNMQKRLDRHTQLTHKWYAVGKNALFAVLIVSNVVLWSKLNQINQINHQVNNTTTISTTNTPPSPTTQIPNEQLSTTTNNDKSATQTIKAQTPNPKTILSPLEQNNTLANTTTQHSHQPISLTPIAPATIITATDNNKLTSPQTPTTQATSQTNAKPNQQATSTPANAAQQRQIDLTTTQIVEQQNTTIDNTTKPKSTTQQNTIASNNTVATVPQITTTSNIHTDQTSLVPNNHIPKQTNTPSTNTAQAINNPITTTAPISTQTLPHSTTTPTPSETTIPVADQPTPQTPQNIAPDNTLNKVRKPKSKFRLSKTTIGIVAHWQQTTPQNTQQNISLGAQAGIHFSPRWSIWGEISRQKYQTQLQLEDSLSLYHFAIHPPIDKRFDFSLQNWNITPLRSTTYQLALRYDFLHKKQTNAYLSAGIQGTHSEAQTITTNYLKRFKIVPRDTTHNGNGGGPDGHGGNGGGPDGHGGNGGGPDGHGGNGGGPDGHGGNGGGGPDNGHWEDTPIFISPVIKHKETFTLPARTTLAQNIVASIGVQQSIWKGFSLQAEAVLQMPLLQPTQQSPQRSIGFKTSIQYIF